jgi:hypothetical protein
VKLENQGFLFWRAATKTENDLALHQCENFLVSDQVHGLLVHEFAAEFRQEPAAANH